ncbi:DEAD box RNA helicase, putative [Leishmania donovani]|uniref:RNA helicase n=1 Tax=Leishmania donovani TaxID=5661 RepID=A0A3Q8IQY6_LEIDO|nr:DEAD box RNA helicase, putative [Leishmania donovani]AYU83573.1 DEAD box RNA helicase, putative [Leishmania donovani]TPP48334.1 DEAD/DEAH box helicase family protein [Leishmania donovani]CBZ38664.1 DEAD box RNA helicase, putative [Leishmania donovani]
MAERNYSPFSGFSTTSRGGGGAHRKGSSEGMGSKLAPVNWSAKSLVPGKWKVVDASAIRKAASVKDDHSASKVKHLSDVEAEEWRQANSITVSDSDQCPNPITEFDMLTAVPQYLKAKLLEQGFKAPTPIQAQSWSIVLSGRDLVGVAKTGSGKTLAFIVPALAHIALQEPLKVGDGPMVIVLAPTRELAQQIEQEAIKVLPQSIRCGCIYGGAPKGPQLGLLRQGVHILVATPGRLIDFMEIKRVNLLRVTYLVLDEADRMLDMGFEPQVRAICGQIRPDRQTLMFSATWPRDIQNLAASFQKNWVRINVGSMELLANKDVTQHFILTSEAAKLDELKRLMERHRNQRVLIFCKTKKTADYLEFQLKRNGVDCMAIHGDKEQRQREFILERFRKDPRLCVVATDVAARGLDIKELETVVNYDFPMQIDDYVHRIGRTGRAGAKGASFTMITKHETQLNASTVFQLVELVERAGQEVPGWLREWAEQGGGYHIPKRNRNMMGSFGRSGPRMRMPGDSPAAGAGSSGGHFGLTPHAKGSPAFGMPDSAIQNKKFDYSSDDDDSARPAKRARQ